MKEEEYERLIRQCRYNIQESLRIITDHRENILRLDKEIEKLKKELRSVQSEDAMKEPVPKEQG